MRWTIDYKRLIPPSDLEALADLLSTRDVFTCAIADMPAATVHGWATWIDQCARHGTQVQLLIDRNLIGHIVASAKGSACNSPDARCAAAVLAWAQYIDALVDPTIASYEGAATSSATDALEELQLLRRADSTNPQAWADLALGYRTALAAGELAPETVIEVSATDLARPLRHFEVHELALLRYVCLLREARGRSESAARSFIQWMHKDFLWDSTAVCYALAVVGTDAGQVGQPKRARGNDRQQARAGVSNQAWDLTLLSHWQEQVERTTDTNRIPILASLDAGLHRIARRVAIGTANMDYEALWTERWGQSARDLVRFMKDLQASHDDAREQRLAKLDRASIDELRTNLESAFAATFPGQ